MITFEKISLTSEKMEEIVRDYERVYNELMEKYGKQLTKYHTFLDRFSAKEIADIVGEKIALLTKIRFEHDLRNVYDPYETDQILVERQEDLMYEMLYATEMYMELMYSNKLNIKNY